ncbi:hypothetical protein H9P43_003214 [Blastocladiella emersonii ATCC 22665]|nr:hypothetical protein H9P43_003214 [Blastocladiella emersonii ATCC 22665]
MRYASALAFTDNYPMQVFPSTLESFSLARLRAAVESLRTATNPTSNAHLESLLRARISAMVVDHPEYAPVLDLFILAAGSPQEDVDAAYQALAPEARAQLEQIITLLTSTADSPATHDTRVKIQQFLQRRHMITLPDAMRRAVDTGNSESYLVVHPNRAPNNVTLSNPLGIGIPDQAKFDGALLTVLARDDVAEPPLPALPQASSAVAKRKAAVAAGSAPAPKRRRTGARGSAAASAASAAPAPGTTTAAAPGQ